MLLKLLVLPASSSWLVDGPARLGEAPEGLFRLGGRVLQGGAVLGQGRNLGLLGALPRERAAQRAEHEILFIFQSCNTRIILALVGAQLVEVFARRAQRILPGFGRHCRAARGSRRLGREMQWAATQPWERPYASRGSFFDCLRSQNRSFAGRGAAYLHALPDLLE